MFVSPLEDMYEFGKDPQGAIGNMFSPDYEQPTTEDPTGLTEGERQAIAQEEAARKAKKKSSGTNTVLTSPLGSSLPQGQRPTLG